MTAIPIPFIKKHISIGTFIIFLLFALGVSIAIYRWINGFSNVSNLSDSRPWGFWISFDLLVSVAISSGAIILAATVHIFHVEKAEHILRPAFLTAETRFIKGRKGVYPSWFIIPYWLSLESS